MKLVSAAKLRRAQEGAENGRAYSAQLNRTVRTILSDLGGEFDHPLANRREEIKTRRVVMVSGERGLCGAYNSNIIKAIRANEIESGVKIEIVAIGRRSVSACRSYGWNAVAEYEGLADDSSLWPIEEIATQLMDDFSEGRCDEVVVYYTKFISAMTQEATKVPLIPLGSLGELGADEQDDAQGSGRVKYSPEPEVILAGLIPALVATSLRHAMLEAKASEHAARMTAMESATKNAGELIDSLRLRYNRARQSSITTELIDIIGGSEAIS